MNMIVAYDIANPKRIAQVARILKDYGVRVQKSIFEVDVNGGVFTAMKKRIETVIVPAEDGVKYFPLCRKCAGTVEIIGQGVYTDPDEEFYIY
ncbi:CRISPR-associated protein, Cas2 family [Syntrophus gentianae]|uniref:CRISPR-associated endoribonuclease Cas2 n=1 Tax=Syntrophus gentianae TaxID=43775 RepID=A0A1H7YIJ3_9BACT|nr:CRISPR-associated endonuclease Cas2 [Syntrophus gentianae]SEM46056.1 CRISPR-associated protein, Cas2 family [Syntrophus gentianae]